MAKMTQSSALGMSIKPTTATRPTMAEPRNVIQSFGVKLGFFFSGLRSISESDRQKMKGIAMVAVFVSIQRPFGFLRFCDFCKSDLSLRTDSKSPRMCGDAAAIGVPTGEERWSDGGAVVAEGEVPC
ncbi:hypothetical protein U1Q18_021422 [Sarracenia purpurea var. burkii]